MKKSSKILGSIALSAALVMGTAAPAFADDWPGKNSNVPDEKNAPTVDVTDGRGTGAIQDPKSTNTDAQGSSTVVTVSTYTSQIDVTVPLYLPIWLDTAGSKAVVPSDGTYYIENRSPVPVAITKADYKNTGDAKINFAAHDALGNDNFYIALLPKETGFTQFYMEDRDANTKAVSNSLNWTIPEKGKLADDGKTPLSKLSLPVQAGSGKIGHAISDAKLATITYTVSVSAGNVAPEKGENNKVGDVTATPEVAAPDFSGYMDGTKTVQDVIDAIQDAYTAAGKTAPTITVMSGGSDRTSNTSYTIPATVDHVTITTNAGTVAAGGELKDATSITVAFTQA